MTKPIPTASTASATCWTSAGLIVPPQLLVTHDHWMSGSTAAVISATLPGPVPRSDARRQTCGVPVAVAGAPWLASRGNDQHPLGVEALRPRRDRRRRPQPRRRGGRAVHPRRPLGVREDDDLEDGEPPDRADLGRDPDRRSERAGDQSGAAPTAHRLRDAAGGPLPAPARRRERGCRPPPPRLGQGPHPLPGRTSCWNSSASSRRATSGATPTSSPAASASASGSPGRSAATLPSC